MSQKEATAEIVYIKAEQSVLVSNSRLFIEDIVKLYSSNKGLVKKLERITALNIKGDKDQKYSLSVLKVMELIHREHPYVNLVNIGETDIVIEYKKPGKRSRIWEVVKAACVCIIVFVGAVFTIMTFNEDVSVSDVFGYIYKMVTGQEQTGSSLLEVGYAIGLPLGIGVFFSHFSKIRMDKDPTPLNMQLRLYEENMNKAILKNAEREGNSIE